MKRTLFFLSMLWLLSARISMADEPAFQSDSFDSKGVKIAYITAGKGEPVILVHGLYSSAQMNWQLPGIVKMLAEHYQVIAPDLRGHGKSDKPTGDDDYGQPMVNDITRLMDHLKIKKAHIVGYSLGGIIVMKFAVDHPERVRSVALGGMGWLKDGSMLQQVWEKMPGREKPGETPPACVHGIAKLAVTKDEVDGIKLPVEMLVGDRDPCRKMYADPLHTERPDFPIVVIDGAGHLNCVTKDQFKQGLLDWIGKNAGN